VSAKGSPGVTTTAAALGAAAASRGETVLLVELDPSGGDAAMLCDRVGETALVALAEELRHGTPAADTVPAHAIAAPPGVPAVLAPSGASEASGVIASLDDRWLPALRGSAATVVVDAGRWEPRGSAARRIAGADVVGLVCRSTAPSVEHARRALDALRGTARCPVAVVVVGGRPYPGEEVAAALDVPLAGVLAWDPRGVTTMWARGDRGRGRRSWLARSATAVLDGLVVHVLAARMDGRTVGSTAGGSR
jgi:MinD-like ATPase involved in chromosome partitioning or flagellar assembly